MWIYTFNLNIFFYKQFSKQLYLNYKCVLVLDYYSYSLSIVIVDTNFIVFGLLYMPL